MVSALFLTISVPEYSARRRRSTLRFSGVSLASSKGRVTDCSPYYSSNITAKGLRKVNGKTNFKRQVVAQSYLCSHIFVLLLLLLLLLFSKGDFFCQFSVKKAELIWYWNFYEVANCWCFFSVIILFHLQCGGHRGSVQYLHCSTSED